MLSLSSSNLLPYTNQSANKPYFERCKC